MAGKNTIGTGAVIITADAAQLTSVLKKSGGEVQDWGIKTGSNATKHLATMHRQTQSVFSRPSVPSFSGMHSAMLGSLSSSFESMVGAAGGVLGSFAGPLGSAVGGAVASGVAKGLTSAIGAARGFASQFKEILVDTSKQGMMASALGLTSEQFTGIAGVAKSVGEDTREFLESLVTMGKLGYEAANGIGEVAPRAFDALGISAKEFISLRTDQQFFKMFEALHAVQDPLQKTRLLMNAFGEDGGKWLLPLLAKTPADLEKMAKGFAVTGKEMKSATAAAESFRNMESQVSKAMRDAAIAVSPAMIEVANGFSKALAESKDSITAIAGAGKSILSWLADGIEPAAKFAKSWIDAANAFKVFGRPPGSGGHVSGEMYRDADGTLRREGGIGSDIYGGLAPHADELVHSAVLFSMDAFNDTVKACTLGLADFDEATKRAQENYLGEIFKRTSPATQTVDALAKQGEALEQALAESNRKIDFATKFPEMFAALVGQRDGIGHYYGDIENRQHSDFPGLSATLLKDAMMPSIAGLVGSFNLGGLVSGVGPLIRDLANMPGMQNPFRDGGPIKPTEMLTETRHAGATEYGSLEAYSDALRQMDRGRQGNDIPAKQLQVMGDMRSALQNMQKTLDQIANDHDGVV